MLDRNISPDRLRECIAEARAQGRNHVIYIDTDVAESLVDHLERTQKIVEAARDPALLGIISRIADDAVNFPGLWVLVARDALKALLQFHKIPVDSP